MIAVVDGVRSGNAALEQMPNFTRIVHAVLIDAVRLALTPGPNRTTGAVLALLSWRSFSGHQLHCYEKTIHPNVDSRIKAFQGPLATTQDVGTLDPLHDGSRLRRTVPICPDEFRASIVPIRRPTTYSHVHRPLHMSLIVDSFRQSRIKK